jgi:hypothetical protein
LGGLFSKKLQIVMAVTEALGQSCQITRRQNTDQKIREMAMKETVIFVGLGLLLAGLDFALDAGIVATVVLPS